MKREDVIQEIEWIDFWIKEERLEEFQAPGPMARRETLMEELEVLNEEKVKLVECNECGGEGCSWCGDRGFQPTTEREMVEEAKKRG